MAKKDVPLRPLTPSITAALPAGAEMIGLTQNIAKLASQISKELAKAAKLGPIPLARAYVCLHRAMKLQDELLKPISAITEEYKTDKIPNLFEQSGVEHVPLSEGWRVGTSSKFSATIIKEKKDDAYKWLRKNELGDLIVETVNAQTLSAAGKVLRDEHNKELPEELFKTTDILGTSVTQL